MRHPGSTSKDGASTRQRKGRPSRGGISQGPKTLLETVKDHPRTTWEDELDDVAAEGNAYV